MCRNCGNVAQRLLWHPDACFGYCGSCSCSCCCRFLLADAWTWSPAACRCELTAEPKSQNIATVVIHLKHFHHRMFTCPNVRQCFAITALLSGFVPQSATCSSLLTQCTRNLCDLISLWFAAIDFVAFNASNGGVPAHRSGPSSLLNSLAHIRDRICTSCPLK